MHNEGESVIVQKFIRTLKNKTYRCMTSISKNVYINKLDDIVNKYNNTYHETIKTKLKIAYIVTKLKYKKVFLEKVTFQIALKTFFLSKKFKNTLPWTYVISDLKGE